MSARNITDAAFLDALSNLGRKPEPSLNIARVVHDFGGDLKLASICRRIADAVYGSKGETVKQSEFDALKAFVKHADGDFALIGICRSERDVDELPIGASRKRYDEDEVWK